MSSGTRERLQHIADEIDYLTTTGAGLTFEAYFANETLKRAFVRSLEIIGQAAKAIAESARTAHPNIPWRKMTGMRDRLTHHYFGVDHQIVWSVLQEDIPALRPAIRVMLDSLEDEA